MAKYLKNGFIRSFTLFSKSFLLMSKDEIISELHYLRKKRPLDKIIGSLDDINSFKYNFQDLTVTWDTTTQVHD